MRIGVLGPFQVWSDSGQECTPPGQRPRDLLTILVTRRGQAVPPETLLDLLWSEEAVGVTTAAVHTVVARVRRALGADIVQTTPTGYRLSPTVAIDEAAFVTEGRASQAAVQRGDIAEAIVAARRGLACWRGRPAFDGAPDDLVAADRARLEEARCTLAEALAGLLVDRAEPGDLEEASDLCAALTAEQPLREAPYGLSMLAAYRRGRQAEALDLYRAVRRVLRDELGVEPTPALTALHAQILTQDPELTPSRGLASSWTPPSTPTESRGKPPAPTSRLVGREPELAEIAEAYAVGRRLITLVGPGGVGKTRLLREAVRATFVDRPVVWVDLGVHPDADTGTVAEAIAWASGTLLESTRAASPVGALVQALAEREVLLAIDEAEWSVAATARVLADLLSGCPGVRLLVTSRQPLELSGERRVLIPPLPYPPYVVPRTGPGNGTAPWPDAPGMVPARAESETELGAYPSVVLLRERLADQAPDLELSSADLPLLAWIAQRVDGLPLALELVVGQASTSSLAELAQASDRPLDLETTERDRPIRQRSLRDTVEWSYQRLSPAGQAALARLSVFVGPFTLEAARAVVGQLPGCSESDGQSLAEVRGLARDALLQVDRAGGGVRMRMLRTVRDFARSVAPLDDLAAAARRHRLWHAARWRGAPLVSELLDHVAAHYEDYVEALRASIEARDAIGTTDLLLTLARLWQYELACDVGLRWFDRARTAGLVDPDRDGQVQVQWAGLLAEAGDERARGAALAAVEQLTGPEDADWLCQAHTALAIWHGISGDFASAEAAGRAAIASAHAGRSLAEGDRHLLAEAQATLAFFLVAAGSFPEGLALAEQAWSAVEGSDSALTLSAVGHKVILEFVEAGEPERGFRIAQEIRRHPRLMDSATMPLPLLINAAWATLATGRAGLALEEFSIALTRMVDLGTLEAFLVEAGAGAALAMDGLAHPDSTETLALVREMLTGTAIGLSPWQDELLAMAGGPDRAGSRSTSAAMARHSSARTRIRQLHALVRDAAGQQRPPTGTSGVAREPSAQPG